MTFVAVWSSRFDASDLLREGKVSRSSQRDLGNQCPRVPISMVNKEEFSPLAPRSLRAS